jgi:signal transduction histidine kinase
MPSGGQLSVTAEEGEGRVTISFSDTGTGIASENLDMIFEPLFTTKATGIGLGLAISRMLVEANRGQIEFESQPENGTVFRVILPVVKGGEA